MFQLVLTFAVATFLSLNYGILLYVNSTFLGNFFSASTVSILFLLGSALNVWLFFLGPRLLARLGKEGLLLGFSLLVFITTLTLPLATYNLVVALAFIIYQASLFMAYWCLDVFLEEKSEDRFTGELRGLYFTFVNAGIALGPLLMGLLSSGEGLEPVYYIGAVILIVRIVISFVQFLRREVRDPSLSKSNLPEIKRNLPLRLWWLRRNVRAVTFARLVLEIFFGIMIIYTPVYLHGTLGFTWSELGAIFTVMLLPFVLLEWPAGEMADRFWGEKEMMSVGFFISGVSLLLMPFLGAEFWLWLLVLVASRIGASLVEINTETYFFKKVGAEDTGLLSIFRIARPVGFILGSAIGLAVTTYISFPAIFFATALVILFGLFESLYLHDTL